MEDVFSGWVYVVVDGSGAAAGAESGSQNPAHAQAQALPRFMVLKKDELHMFRRDLWSYPQEEATFSGVLQKGTVLSVHGRRVLPQGQVLHVFSIALSSEQAQAQLSSRGVEIGCSTAEAAHEWVQVLEAAVSGAVHTDVDATSLPSADGLGRSMGRVVAIGKDSVKAHLPERGGAGAEEDEDDCLDTTKWHLVKLVNGLRIFEGQSDSEEEVVDRLLKAEGVVEAEPDRIFEVIMDLSRRTRSKWDVLSVDAYVLEVIDGFTDVCYNTVSVPRKGGKPLLRELLYKRTWTRNNDGSYVISLFPLPEHQNLKTSEKLIRFDNTVFSWDIVPLCGPRQQASSLAAEHGASGLPSQYARSLVRYVLEVHLNPNLHAQGSAWGGAGTHLAGLKFLRKGTLALPFFKADEKERSQRLEKEKEKHKEKERESTGITAPPPGSMPTGSWGPSPVPSTDLEELLDGLPYQTLCRVAGLREYFAALPPPHLEAAPLLGQTHRSTESSATDFFPRTALGSVSAGHGVLSLDLRASSRVVVGGDEFFDALESTVRQEEGTLKREAARKRWQRLKWLLRFGLLFQSLTDSEGEGAFSDESWCVRRELLHNVAPVSLAKLGGQLALLGSVPRGPQDAASLAGAVNAWRDPGGANFVVRGRNYLQDRVKVPAGEPLLKLVAMDWFTDSKRIDGVAGRPGCLTRSEAGKAIPFFFVINLQVPGPPHYSLVAYFAADRPLRGQPQSLLHRFKSGDNAFRNSRLKLIPRIAEGHWMVKRAVGTKACILGKALTCSYNRGPNYLEMECDIGSSSVARNVIGLVISYVTTLVVDLVFLIEAQESEELPEYLLGALTCIRLDTKKAVAPPPEGKDAPAAPDAAATSAVTSSAAQGT